MNEYLQNEAATLRFGERLAELALTDELVTLRGELGTGKTTLVRGFLAALGHSGSVRSPTYTLVEPYDLGGQRIYHLDFYRIADPRELTYLGFDDLVAEPAIKLVEWPEMAGDKMPAAAVEIVLTSEGEGRRVVLRDLR